MGFASPFRIALRTRLIAIGAAALACIEPRLQAAVTPPPDALQHWAFQPIASVLPPAVQHPGWGRTDVDRFILARLESAGIEPAPATDPRTWLRRLSMDLIGLPPSIDEVNAFTDAWNRDPDTACHAAIERLLAHPGYGERWGRHWLDLARYSDTKGYVYAREESRFVHAPAYRDWVIAAFNRDLPYDRFLQLQIAADQIVPPGSPDLAAMGFITGGRRFLGVTHDIIDDRIDVVCRTTLGLTVACARCHDHKYDPIPTADYYSLYGVFQGSDDALEPLATSDDAELASRRKKFSELFTQRRQEAEQRLRSRVDDYLRAQLHLHQYPEEGFDQILQEGDLIPQSVRRWRDWLARSDTPADPVLGPWRILREMPEPPPGGFEVAARRVLREHRSRHRINGRIGQLLEKPISGFDDLAQRYGDVFREVDRQDAGTLSDPDLAELSRFLLDPGSPTRLPEGELVNVEYHLPTRIIEDLWKASGDVDRRLIELGVPAARVLRERPPGPNPRIFRRGSPAQPGPEVPRQFLSALAGPDRRPFSTGSGRLDLARAIANPSNALTARTLVNRVWQYHFGNGLVRTSSDLGLRAEPPSHPELLDWLARRFIADGWSIKSLHRHILRSTTYRTAGGPPPPSDPENRLLARFPRQRLGFEQLRDAMLAASGELDATMGGKPSVLLDPTNRRRTVYSLVDRQFLPGVLRTFDFANPDLHVAVRHETTVPQQGLFFLNGPFAAQRARVLAARSHGMEPARRVEALYAAVLQRRPSSGETAAALRFIQGAPHPTTATAIPWDSRPWRYGTGEFDPVSAQLRSFRPLPHFTGTAWQGSESLPGGEPGWANLTAGGGHPGNTHAHACVRRWIAPRALRISIRGTLRHEPVEGDGIRAVIIAGTHGTVASASIHHGETSLNAGPLDLKAGESVDFIIDIGNALGFDQFLWNPVIESDGARWDSRADFAGPAPADIRLQPWEQYAQVLLLTNEFAFTD